ncbi:hypothetical protein LOTGIDRAFT_162697 [Lottia gigantea]|uniref:Uncharacterized protein n=1 Tax=Lottia gigantea TaxID=225164 RepID=V4A6Q8_LOTGI|nr:hypothetical protein LOTGIDRAFT_162697 [Lottia gigantea]ESO92387.1 hypothetical protein LOTGIDRAFT_162697 [Lottia gigantea]
MPWWAYMAVVPYLFYFSDCENVSQDSGMLLFIPKEENKENVAIGKPTGISTIKHNMPSCRAVDGDFTTFFHTHKVTFSWWCVDLLKYYDFTKITIYNRDDPNTEPNRIKTFEIGFKNEGSCNNATYLAATWCYKDDQQVQTVYHITGCNMSPIQPFGSRFIFVKLERVPIYPLHFREMIVSVS